MAMKKSNIKKRRRLIAIVCIFLILIFISWLIFRKKDYTIEYEKNDYKIKETYNKEKDYYSFLISKGEKTYYTILPNSHFLSKKLIYEITTLETEEENCIKIFSNKLRFSPLCQKENTQISYHLVSEEMKEKLQEKEKEIPLQKDVYNQIEINTLLYNDYYIWNYRGFYHLKNDTKETISLFEKDIYEPKLLAKVEDYLFIPDYNSEYFFEKVTLLNRKTGKQEIWKLKEPIYFDSIILGELDGFLYLVDKHEKVEWKINPKKKTMEKIGNEKDGGTTYQNKWIDVSMTKLLNNDYTFKGIYPMEYKIENGLKAKIENQEILLKEQSPTKIITTLEKGVFYLQDDILYTYQEEYGEVQIMKFFEWNFNSTNVIFIF